MPIPTSGNNISLIQKPKHIIQQRKNENEETKGILRGMGNESPGNIEKRRSSSKFGKFEKDWPRFPQQSKIYIRII